MNSSNVSKDPAPRGGAVRCRRLWAGALLAFGLALVPAGEAQAQCSDSNPEMICPLSVCIALQADVTLQCKTPAPVSCNSIVGCSPLQAMKRRWLDCGAARSRINVNCFGGGNIGHQTALAQVYQNVGTCDARIALPRPVGCTDPCSQSLAATDTLPEGDLLAQLGVTRPWLPVEVDDDGPSEDCEAPAKGPAAACEPLPEGVAEVEPAGGQTNHDDADEEKETGGRK